MTFCSLADENKHHIWPYVGLSGFLLGRFPLSSCRFSHLPHRLTCTWLSLAEYHRTSSCRNGFSLCAERSVSTPLCNSHQPSVPESLSCLLGCCCQAVALKAVRGGSDKAHVVCERPLTHHCCSPPDVPPLENCSFVCFACSSVLMVSGGAVNPVPVSLLEVAQVLPP